MGTTFWQKDVFWSLQKIVVFVVWSLSRKISKILKNIEIGYYVGPDQYQSWKCAWSAYAGNAEEWQGTPVLPKRTHEELPQPMRPLWLRTRLELIITEVMMTAQLARLEGTARWVRFEIPTILSTHLAPVSPDSLEKKCFISDKKQVLHFPNSLNSTGGGP